ncbi:MAG: bifunctional metallophosphatase/5'-nucleotidase [Bacteroidales bacterium]|nr:bifunctional metallophosphatase/5'-nucleotidase [Bacteroidales bacterium]
MLVTTRHNKIFALIITVAVALLLAVGNANAQKTDEKVLYVVSVNDMHGNIDNFPQFASLLDTLRKQYPDLLLISAGDNRTGHPVNDRYPKPSYPITKLMNEVHFDLSTLGNHEFDIGVEGLRNVVDWSDFDYVCANAYFDDSINVKPYKIINYKGLKIGFIGGIQVGANGIPDFHPKYAQNVSFKPIVDILPEYMFLRKECDMLFLISHCGLEADIEIAKKFPQFDAIFGGHTHKKIERTKLIGNTMITQSGKNLNYLTVSVFYFTNGKIDYKAQQVFSVKDFPKKDEKIQKLVDEFGSLDIFSRIVGYTDADTTNKEQLGYFLADAIRAHTKSDLAFQNPGGVRMKSLPQGKITAKDIYQMDPFNNIIMKYKVSGQEIIDMLEKANKETGDFPMLCSGCSIKLNVNEYEEIESMEILLDNVKSLDPNSKYDIAINSYMASVYGFSDKHKGKEYQHSNEIVFGYLKKQQHINYSCVSRIIYVLPK